MFHGDTPPRLQSRGFFRLSSIRDRRSDVAWPRLIAHRSGGGKARKRAHACMHPVPGRCHARFCFHASYKGKHGPQLAVGVLESRNTRLFRGSLPGNLPAGVEAFPVAILAVAALLPKAVDWLLVPSEQQIADYSLVNAVTFLPTVLHGGTRTLFSFQGATALFSQRRTKVEMQGLKPHTPDSWV
jgi:hypothetical protein